MKNAHQRFGKLVYRRRTEKTATNLRVFLEAFVGEDRGKGHSNGLGGCRLVAERCRRALVIVLNSSDGRWPQAFAIAEHSRTAERHKSAPPRDRDDLADITSPILPRMRQVAVPTAAICTHLSHMS